MEWEDKMKMYLLTTKHNAPQQINMWIKEEIYKTFHALEATKDWI
jgi:hypothetical protein